MSTQSPNRPEHPNLHTAEPPSSHFLDNIDCTASTRFKLLLLARQATQLHEGAPPTTTTSWLAHREVIVANSLESRRCELEALTQSKLDITLDGGDAPKTVLITQTKQAVKDLLVELCILLTNRHIICANINERIRLQPTISTSHISSAYSSELITLLSDDAAAKASRVTTRQASIAFAERMHGYLGTEREAKFTGDKSHWCNVLGCLLPSEIITPVPITPLSWDTPETAYLFGLSSNPLSLTTDPRNGLSLSNHLAKSFVDGDIVILPLPPPLLSSSPTNPSSSSPPPPPPPSHIIRVLNPSILSKTFFHDTFKRTSRRIWKYCDIDSQPLHFPTAYGRPANRYLYLRFLLTYLHAHAQKRVAAIDILTSYIPLWMQHGVDQNSGYLRKSVVLELAKQITGGIDVLPPSLIAAGIFEDKASSTAIQDTVAGIRIGEMVQGYLDGDRDAMYAMWMEEDEFDDEDYSFCDGRRRGR
ncbi:MAG: hypothetical protein Q9168_008296 [Polycauliona sp. 1 TL-2023]